MTGLETAERVGADRWPSLSRPRAWEGGRRGVAVSALALAVTLATGAVVFTTAPSRATTYDEGVYLASFDAIAEGQRLGGDVYTSQPPVFYALGRGVLALVGRDLGSIRIVFALVALLSIAAAFAAARLLYGTGAGLAAAGLVTIAPPLPQNAALATAGMPAVALALVATAIFAGSVSARSRRLAVGAGVVLGVAIGIKLLVAPFAVLFSLIALSRRRSRALLPSAAAGAAAVLAIVAIVYASELGEIVDGVFGDHVALGATRAANLDRVALHGIEWKTPFAWLVLAGLVVFVAVPRARAAWPIWAAVLPFGAFLVALRPLLDHHFVLLSAGLALASGCSLGLGLSGFRGVVRWGTVATIGLLVAAGAFQQQHRLSRDSRPEPADVLWTASILTAATTTDERVATDMPVVAFRADRRLPGELVDLSFVRFASGSLTDTDIERALTADRPPVLVVRRELAKRTALLDRLRRRYPVAIECGSTTVMAARPLPAIDCPGS